MTTLPLAWIITDGSAGMENQAWGLAELLGYEVVVKRYTIKKPWLWFSPFIRFAKRFSVINLDANNPLPLFPKPWPSLIVCCGRRSILVGLYLKEYLAHHKLLSKILYLQDPKISAKHFDVVVRPLHDNIKGPNVLTMAGAPHRITLERLALAKKEFEPMFAEYKGPRIVVLLGGDSGRYKFNLDVARKVCELLQNYKINHGASLLITPSRRTSAEILDYIKKYFEKDRAVYVWDKQSTNPYFGILALSDGILVGCDSVSMISEACFSGAPVHLLSMEGESSRIGKFHQGLINSGRVSWANKNQLFDFTKEYAPLDDMDMLLKQIKSILNGDA